MSPESVARTSRCATTACTLLLLALAACRERPKSPTTPPDVGTPPPSAPALSRFAVPLDYDATAVLRLVDQTVPRVFGSMDSVRAVNGDSRKHYAFEASRGPFTAFAVDSEVHLRATLAYQARGYYKPPIGPTLSAGCGNEHERPRLVVELATPLSLSADWHLRSRVRLVAVRAASSQARDRCDVSILHLDVTDRVVDAARGALRERLPAIDRRVASVDLGEHVAEWWSLLERPIRLADSVWLALHPERLRMGTMRGTSLVLTVPVSLDARPRIVTGSEPAPSTTPPPPLAADSVGDGFRIQLEGLVDYGTASRAVGDALEGRRLTRAGRTVTVQDASVQPGAHGRLVLSLAFAGDASGRLRLVGTPRYDARSGAILVPDLDFDLESDSRVVNGYAWLRSDELRASIREGARFPVAPALARGRELLTSGLNRTLGDAVTLSATVDSVGVTGLYVTRDGVLVRADATGHARVAVHQR
jgi:hypothetical protein